MSILLSFSLNLILFLHFFFPGPDSLNSRQINFQNRKTEKLLVMVTVYLKELQCRWCEQIFYICQSCWRGQAYCCDACRVTAFRIAKQNRQRKYRRTAKGRQRHRRNERKRRMRRSKKTVGDAGSNFNSVVISSRKILFSTSECCCFCGRRGVVVKHFPRRGYGSSQMISFERTNDCPGEYDDQKNAPHSRKSP